MSISTDPIADFLTQIRNSMRAGKQMVTVPGSKMTSRLSEILKQEGFIDNFKVIEDGKKKSIRIHLKYLKPKKPAIQSVIRISKPGLRRYVGCEDIPRVLGGLGFAIVSTSKGVMTDKQARAAKIGGELICKVW